MFGDWCFGVFVFDAFRFVFGVSAFRCLAFVVWCVLFVLGGACCLLIWGVVRVV